jgi:hypothetical protein
MLVCLRWCRTALDVLPAEQQAAMRGPTQDFEEGVTIACDKLQGVAGLVKVRHTPRVPGGRQTLTGPCSAVASC